MWGSDGFRVRCPEPLNTQVRDFSVKTGRSFSDIIRDALREYLGKHQKEVVADEVNLRKARKP